MKSASKLTYSLMFILLGLATCLHSNISPNHQLPSDQPQQQVLQQTQTRLTNQITIMQAKLAQITKALESNSTTSTKLNTLNKSIGEQRDSLADIEKYLQPPYNLRICQCPQITQKQRNDIDNQLTQMSGSVATLQKQLQQCGGSNCPKYTQISQQLNQLKSYLSTTRDILSPSCCEAKKRQFKEETATGLVDLNNTLYKDNLKGNNWYYGSITQEEYRLKQFELSTKFNVSTCSEDKPYANNQLNRCQRCHPRHSMFNLGTRSCYWCGGLAFLNRTTSLCVQCPSNQYYNTTSQSCVYCNEDQFLNTTSQACQYCANGLKFDLSQNSCVSCPDGKIYDTLARQCMYCSSNKYYDSVTKSCQLCPRGTSYSQQQKQCVSTSTGSTGSNGTTGTYEECPQGDFYDELLGQCVNNNNIGICPHDKPYYDVKADKCVECPAGTKINNVSYVCQKI